MLTITCTEPKKCTNCDEESASLYIMETCEQTTHVCGECKPELEEQGYKEVSQVNIEVIPEPNL
ncbi:hypothetical protein ACFL29_02120 [Patescibacteria group bacterium]